MIKVKSKTAEGYITLDCEKPNGQHFELVVDADTFDIIKKPKSPDIDASAVYSRVYKLLSAGKQIPETFSSDWG